MNDDVVKLMLASCIVHLIEHIDTGEELDKMAAIGNLSHIDVTEYLGSLDDALLPVRRDGKPPFDLSI